MYAKRNIKKFLLIEMAAKEKKTLEKRTSLKKARPKKLIYFNRFWKIARLCEILANVASFAPNCCLYVFIDWEKKTLSRWFKAMSR